MYSTPPVTLILMVVTLLLITHDVFFAKNIDKHVVATDYTWLVPEATELSCGF